MLKPGVDAKRLSLKEFEHIDVVDGEVFALQLVLLGLHQIGFARHQFDNVFQSEAELLAEQLIAGELALSGHLGSLELALVGGGIYPLGLDGVVELLLLVLEFEETVLTLQLCLVHLCLSPAVVEDGNAQAGSDRHVEVGLELMAVSFVVHRGGVGA